MNRPGTAADLAALRVAAWIVFCTSSLRTQTDPDLWGHTRFGLDLLQSHRLTSLDPYSFTQDVPWVNHEWLAEVFMGAAFTALGPSGLIILKGIVASATFLTIATAYKQASPSWRWPSLLLAALGSQPVVLTVRPQLWTLLFLTLECRILAGGMRSRYWLPPMFAVWANMHGGWILGAMVLGLWSLAECFEPKTERPPRWFTLAIVAACLVATLCTPYGWGLWRFLATTVRLSRANISEWRPIWNDDLDVVLLWTAGGVWILFVIRYSERWPRAKVILPVAMLFLQGLLVVRIVALSIAASTILLASSVPKPRLGSEPVWPKGRTALDAAVACLGVVLIVFGSGPPNCIQIPSGGPDVAAISALSASQRPGRLITWFDWGEYAIWHLGPRMKVSIDGRRETVYSQQVLQQQAAIAFGEPAALRFVEQSLPEYAWLPNKYSHRAHTWFSNHGYRIDVEAASSFVAVRGDLPRLSPATSASSGCFPGP